MEERELIFLTPVLKETIWGGTRLEEDYGYPIPSRTTGECWGISAHEHGDCVIASGKFAGRTLSDLWKNHRELFGMLKGDRFPLLVKIIDAREDLSIQVHPDDCYARQHEHGALGKTECWYILDCAEDAQIVIGHHAKSREEARRMVEEQRWDEWIRKIPVHRGDFFQINPGCIHAIGKGTLLLETQQNSDITYRVYDYDRLSDGKKRELHIDKSLEVIQAPFEPADLRPVKEEGAGYRRTLLQECGYYRVSKLDIDGRAEFALKEPFLNVSVTEGSGMIDGITVKKGTHLIIPSGYGTYIIEGALSAIVSSVPQE